MHNLIQRAIWISLGAAMIVSTGCAVFGGSSREESRAKNYRLNVPPGWQSKEHGESDAVYQLASGALATITTTCGRHTGAPLELLTKHFLFGSRNVAVDRRESVMVDGAAGLRSWVRATMDGRPFFLELVVSAKQGCVFDFSLLSPKKISESDEEAFMSVIKNFHYEP